MPQLFSKKRTIRFFLIVLAVGIIIFGGYEILNRTGLISTFKLAYQLQQQKSISVEDRRILEQLGKIMVLPGDIAPTLAIVTDVEALKNQQPLFFANAHAGDRLILYPDKAILFDPKANKIVNVGPVQEQK